MKLSGSNYGMPRLTIDEALAFHAELGLEAIEITILPGYATALESWSDGERRRVRELLRRHEIVVSGVADFQSLVDPDGPATDALLAHHRGAIDLAVDLAWRGDATAPPLVVFYSAGSNGDWPDARVRLLDRIGGLAEHARARGVVLAMKAHANGCVSRPHQLVDLFEQVGSTAFRFCFDMSHYEVQGLSIEQAMYPLLPLSAHVEVKASVGRSPGQEYMIPGEPNTQSDFDGQFRAMAALGYRGHVVPEMSVHVQRRPDYDPRASLRLAIETLRPLVAA
ncbi:MAG TPA: sugar phosphate isomerase/epimerase [Chloroflexota bacterium]|nr:sugar phosphate isomerase/epimerase [Chloroflexota bacterium]